MIAKFARLPFVLVLPLVAQPFVAQSLVAPQIPPSEMLDAKTIRSASEELLQQARAAKDGLAFRLMLDRPDGNEQIAVRVKSGRGEWHHDFEDVLIGLEGEAQVVTGGTMVNGRETAPGEIRGEGIAGGRVQPFRPGDVIRVEAGVPHQFLLPPGGAVKYFTVKIKVAK